MSARSSRTRQSHMNPIRPIQAASITVIDTHRRGRPALPDGDVYMLGGVEDDQENQGAQEREAPTEEVDKKLASPQIEIPPEAGPSTIIVRTPPVAGPSKKDPPSIDASAPPIVRPLGGGPSRSLGPLTATVPLLERSGVAEMKEISNTDLEEFKESQDFEHRSLYVFKSEAKERVLRAAALTDQKVTVLKGLGTSTKSLFRLAPAVIARMVKSIGDQLGDFGPIYTVYVKGSFNYKANGNDEIKTVNKAILLASYPFLWTLLVLFWYYGEPEDQDGDGEAQEPQGTVPAARADVTVLPNEILQVYLCVWRDASRYQHVVNREERVAASNVLKGPAIPQVAPLEPAIMIRLRLDWDLISASNRIIESVQRKIKFD